MWKGGWDHDREARKNWDEKMRWKWNHLNHWVRSGTCAEGAQAHQCNSGHLGIPAELVSWWSLTEDVLESGVGAPLYVLAWWAELGGRWCLYKRHITSPSPAALNQARWIDTLAHDYYKLEVYVIILWLTTVNTRTNCYKSYCPSFSPESGGVWHCDWVSVRSFVGGWMAQKQKTKSRCACILILRTACLLGPFSCILWKIMSHFTSCVKMRMMFLTYLSEILSRMAGWGLL